MGVLAEGVALLFLLAAEAGVEGVKSLAIGVVLRGRGAGVTAALLADELPRLLSLGLCDGVSASVLYAFNGRSSMDKGRAITQKSLDK
jgi:hypothetical protein